MLEQGLEMIGQRVMCPHCRAEFRLRREKSIEFLHQQEIIDRRRAKFWFQLSVVVGTFVGVVLIAMIVMIMVVVMLKIGLVVAKSNLAGESGFGQ